MTTKTIKMSSKKLNQIVWMGDKLSFQNFDEFVDNQADIALKEGFDNLDVFADDLQVASRKGLKKTKLFMDTIKICNILFN